MSAQQEAKDAALRDALRSRYVRGVAVEATVGVWEAAFDAAWRARGEADRAAVGMTPTPFGNMRMVDAMDRIAALDENGESNGS